MLPGAVSLPDPLGCFHAHNGHNRLEVSFDDFYFGGLKYEAANMAVKEMTLLLPSHSFVTVSFIVEQ